MSGKAETMNAIASGDRTTRRVAGAFVLVVMVVACIVFWIGIPIGVLWALSKATDSFAGHFVLGLLLVPMAMVAFAPALFWLNNLYLRVTGVFQRLAEDQREAGWQRRVRGPLEPMLLTSFAVALIGLFVWFFVFAENPPPTVW